MSKLGKILLYIAVLGGVADVFAGWESFQKFGTDKTALVQTQQERDAAKAAATSANAKADAAAQAETAAQTELTEAKTKVDDLTSKLTAEQTQADQANTALTQAQAAEKTANDNLQHVKDVLGDMTPEQALAATKKAQDDLTAAQSDMKIMQDEKQAVEEQIADLKAEINKGPSGMPPGISGKVTFVNRAWNFVVLNVGLANGVVPNGELIVYRGRDFLGKVKVSSAETSSAVADIMPDAKADIQVGDSVLN